MKKSILLFFYFFFAFLSSTAIAQNINKKSDSFEIPFLVKQAEMKTFLPMSASYRNESFISNELIKAVSSDELKTFLLGLKKTICSVDNKATAKVWISVSAEGKIVVLGAETKSGIEINFSCGK